MIQAVVFDTKTYDREALQRAAAGLDIEWHFMDCRLSAETAETAAAAHGAQAACTFVNDCVTRPCLEALKSGRLGGVALDVFEEEEGVFFEGLSGQILHDDELARLRTFPNVLITAHQAFLTHEALAEIARVTTANLAALATDHDFLADTVLVQANRTKVQ